jgi:uncharacterized protein (TIGR02246 family)
MLKASCLAACPIVALLYLVGAAAAQPDNVKTAIDRANAAFVAAFAKGDSAAIAAMYSAGGQAFPPNSDVLRTRDAIRKLWQGAMDGGVKSVKLQAIEVESHGPDRAHEVGSYSMMAADGKVVDRGKYLVIWKREGGQWKLHRDIWNTSLPPAK